MPGMTLSGEQRVEFAETLGEQVRLRRAVKEGQEAQVALAELRAADDRLYEEWGEFAGFEPVVREPVAQSPEERLYAELSARTGR